MDGKDNSKRQKLENRRKKAAKAAEQSKKAEQRDAKRKELEELKKGDGYQQGQESEVSLVKDIEVLDNDIKKIEKDDDSYEPMDVDEPRPSVEDSEEPKSSEDGGLLDDVDLISDSPQGVGGHAIASAGRFGIVLRFGQDTSMSRYAFGAGDGPDLPDITDTVNGDHRLCSKKVSKSEFKGKKLNFKNIHGVVWDWRGRDEDAALDLLNPAKMKQGCNTMAERRKWKKEHDGVRLEAYPTTYVLVSWKDQSEKTWESGADFKRMWKDIIGAERLIQKVALKQKERYDNTAEGRKARESSALLSRESTPDEPTTNDAKEHDPTPASPKQGATSTSATGLPSPPRDSSSPPTGDADEKQREEAWKAYLASYTQARGGQKPAPIEQMKIRGKFNGEYDQAIGA